jgi:hypothetical protein
MGCDIHAFVERKIGDIYEYIDGFEPFKWRSYGTFGFLADVRNYSDVTPISARRGVPDDASDHVKSKIFDWSSDGHSHSWISVKELDEFDYDQPMEDRRVTRQLASNLWFGAETSRPGGGEMTTYRDFLGESFFDDIAELHILGADRVVFFFDN